jgi:hypothetical protein
MLSARVLAVGRRDGCRRRGKKSSKLLDQFGRNLTAGLPSRSSTR